MKPVNIMETRLILPPTPLTPPKIVLPGGQGSFNPKPEVMCSTMNAVPATSALLSKMKLPLAIHIHPYKELNKQVCIYTYIRIYMHICRGFPTENNL